MTEGIGICFFASRGKCSESTLCDAKPQQIIEASLNRGDDEHKKISEIIESYEKHGHDKPVVEVHKSCITSYTSNGNIQKRAGVPSTDEDVSTEKMQRRQNTGALVTTPTSSKRGLPASKLLWSPSSSPELEESTDEEETNTSCWSSNVVLERWSLLLFSPFCPGRSRLVGEPTCGRRKIYLGSVQKVWSKNRLVCLRQAPFLSNERTSCWRASLFFFPILCWGGLVGNDIGDLESNSSLWPLTASLTNLSLASWSHQVLLSSRWPKNSTSFAQWPCPSSGATASSASARAAATAADLAQGLTEKALLFPWSPDRGATSLSSRLFVACLQCSRQKVLLPTCIASLSSRF